ncbi:carboxypeptidase-like regulatory domain-containing protein [Paraburkholderia aromaticivorans]|uniref:Carboxypeptidase regulatory-like domain-containing protein n=1 Tax=Paraburkholderia aromaticivorans TaxID=2026199 RepID=A0A248VKX9_9BURK|nr:carboxypeptidase-like regulatory domain-containing protein [Paraburkholderia aromaticivorans]ASV99069.1 hypothetical protein CJU94_13450 [Paraburkholderia aromaticivorans]
MRILKPRALRICVAFVLFAMSAAVAGQSLPEAVSRDGVLYMTGGIGEDDAKAFRALAPRYSLRMMFTAAAGNYLSDVDVTIASAAGRAVLDARTEGPFLFVMLPAGRYRIVAHAGRAEVAKTVDVPRRGGTDLHIVLQERATGVAQTGCAHCRAAMRHPGEP